MNLIKKFAAVLLVVVPILLLVVIRSTGSGHFKSDSRKLAESSLSHLNRVNREQALKLPGKRLIISLDRTKITDGTSGDIRYIAADSVLDKRNVKSFMKHDGPILLLSTEPALSARIWILLSQIGCRNIYILTEDSDNEVLKYKFRPDSVLN